MQQEKSAGAILKGSTAPRLAHANFIKGGGGKR